MRLLSILGVAAAACAAAAPETKLKHKFHKRDIPDARECAKQPSFSVPAGEIILFSVGGLKFDLQPPTSWNFEEVKEFLGQVLDFGSYLWSDVTFHAVHTSSQGDKTLHDQADGLKFYVGANDSDVKNAFESASEPSAFSDIATAVHWVVDPAGLYAGVWNRVVSTVQSVLPEGEYIDAARNAAGNVSASVLAAAQHEPGFFHMSPYEPRPTRVVGVAYGMGSEVAHKGDLRVECRLNRVSVKYPMALIGAALLYIWAPALSAAQYTYLAAGFGIGAVVALGFVTWFLWQNRHSKLTFVAAGVSALGAGYAGLVSSWNRFFGDGSEASAPHWVAASTSFLDKVGAYASAGFIAFVVVSAVTMGLVLWFKSPESNPKVVSFTRFSIRCAALFAIAAYATGSTAFNVALVAALIGWELVSIILSCILNTCPCLGCLARGGASALCCVFRLCRKKPVPGVVHHRAVQAIRPAGEGAARRTIDEGVVHATGAAAATTGPFFVRLSATGEATVHQANVAVQNGFPTYQQALEAAQFEMARLRSIQEQQRAARVAAVPPAVRTTAPAVVHSTTTGGHAGYAAAPAPQPGPSVVHRAEAPQLGATPKVSGSHPAPAPSTGGFLGWLTGGSSAPAPAPAPKAAAPVPVAKKTVAAPAPAPAPKAAAPAPAPAAREDTSVHGKRKRDEKTKSRRTRSPSHSSDDDDDRSDASDDESLNTEEEEEEERERERRRAKAKEKQRKQDRKQDGRPREKKARRDETTTSESESLSSDGSEEEDDRRNRRPSTKKSGKSSSSSRREGRSSRDPKRRRRDDTDDDDEEEEASRRRHAKDKKSRRRDYSESEEEEDEPMDRHAKRTSSGGRGSTSRMHVDDEDDGSDDDDVEIGDDEEDEEESFDEAEERARLAMEAERLERERQRQRAAAQAAKTAAVPSPATGGAVAVGSLYQGGAAPAVAAKRPAVPVVTAKPAIGGAGATGAAPKPAGNALLNSLLSPKKH